MFERIVVVIKKTPLEELLLRHSLGQARFFLQHRGTSIEEYEASHKVYHDSLKGIIAALPYAVPQVTIGRELAPTFLFRPTDLIIVVGPDGLCVNTLKYLDDQLVIAVNPDPGRIDGILMRVAPGSVVQLIDDIKKNDFKTDRVTLAKVTTNDGQNLYAVNDFLIGRRDQISARYTIKYGGNSERQSSSGILVSTGVGVTGWMSSVLGRVEHLPWDARELVFVVREPFLSKYTQADVTFGRISERKVLTVVSEMPEGGVIFSDGVPEDAIEFNSGTVASIGVAEKSARLVMPTAVLVS